MDLQQYVENVRRELLIAAEAGGDEARALAERLVAPLDSAIRLTLLGALSTAADEITRDMAPGSVDLRLRGLDPTFVVTPVAVEQPYEATEQSLAPVPDEEGATARINFRPPEQLKSRIEDAASREGLSVNAWLVRAVNAVLSSGGNRPGGNHPGGTGTGGTGTGGTGTGGNRAGRRASWGGQSYTGWVE